MSALKRAPDDTENLTNNPRYLGNGGYLYLTESDTTSNDLNMAMMFMRRCRLSTSSLVHVVARFTLHDAGAWPLVIVYPCALHVVRQWFQVQFLTKN